MPLPSLFLRGGGREPGAAAAPQRRAQVAGAEAAVPRGLDAPPGPRRAAGPGLCCETKGRGVRAGPPHPVSAPPIPAALTWCCGARGPRGGRGTAVVGGEPRRLLWGEQRGGRPAPWCWGYWGYWEGRGAHPPSCRCSAGPANGPGPGRGPAAPGRRAGPGGSGARPVWGQRVRLGGGHTGRGQDGSHSPARSGGSPG